jgi:hypothetical protein
MASAPRWRRFNAFQRDEIGKRCRLIKVAALKDD